MAEGLKLYSYWRSSAAYRVRIALALKDIPYDLVPVHLLRSGGEQHGEAFRDLNSQGLVPILVDGGRVVRQSMAIIEYLEETYEGDPLMPATARERARVRSLAQTIACDIHPLNNLRVMQFLEREFSVPEEDRARWMRHWIHLGLEALEPMLSENPSTGTYCEGDVPTMADICLVPQLYNARRYGVDVSQYPTIARIEASCLALEPFQVAAPERQPDANT